MANDLKGITIKIGGDTSELKKELDSVNESSKKVQKELSQINRQLKFDTSNVVLTQQKHKLLGEQVKNTEEKLKTLKQAQADFDKEALKTEEGAAQYRALQREIEATESKLKNLKLEYANTSEWTRTLTDVGEKMQTIGEKATKVGTALTAGVTAPIAGIAAASTKAFTEVHGGIENIISKTGASGKALDGMQKSMENLAGTIPTSFATAGEAIGEVNTRFHLTGDELEELSGQFIKFADINGLNVTSSVDQAQKALSAFGLGAGDASDLLDVLNKTGQATGSSMDKLLSGLIQNGTAFQEMGLSIEQSTVLMGQMETSGANSETVMQGLRKALKNAAEEGVPLNQALGDLQDTILNGKDGVDGLTAAYDLFGKSGDQIYGAVKNGTLDFKNLADVSIEAGDSVSSTFEATQTPMDRFQTSLNTVKLVGADLASTFLNMLAPIMERVRDVVAVLKEKWDGLSESQKEMIVKIAGIAAAAGPLLVVFGKITSGIGGIILHIAKIPAAIVKVSGALGAIGKVIGTVGTALKGLFSIMLANPITIVIAAIAALIAIGVTLYKKCDGFRKFVDGMIAGIKKLFSSLPGFFSNLWNTITSGVKKAWDGIKTSIDNTIKSIKDAITKVFNDIKTFITNTFNTIKTTITTIWNGIKTFFQTVLNGIKLVFTTIWNGIKAFLQLEMNGIKVVFTTAWNAIKTVITTIQNALKTVITTVWNGIKTAVTNVLNTIRTVVQSVWNGIRTTIQTVMNGIRTVVDNVWNGIRTVVTNAVNTIRNNVTNGFNTMRNAVMNPLNNIRTSVSNIFNNVWNTVSGVVNKLKNAFRFSWSLPHIKLPHFSISGKFSLNPPSIPKFSISWYKKAMDNAMALDAATIFGFNPATNNFLGGGEAGREYITGEKHLQEAISMSVSARNRELERRIDRTNNLLERFIPQILNKGSTIVLDTGAMVGEMMSDIDMGLGTIQAHKARGN